MVKLGSRIKNHFVDTRLLEVLSPDMEFLIVVVYFVNYNEVSSSKIAIHVICTSIAFGDRRPLIGLALATFSISQFTCLVNAVRYNVTNLQRPISEIWINRVLPTMMPVADWLTMHVTFHKRHVV